jgi:beta-glucosidase
MSSVPKPKHDHHLLQFPKGFLWGAATSGHQVEGNNFYNDWWEWEQHQPPSKRSGRAADQYHRYAEDFDLAKQFSHNAHRLSIEWSRIEPVEGHFNLEEIEHYKKVLKALKDRGFTVMLTLHHFTNPLWFTKKGGWESLLAPFYFERFVKRITPELKDYVDLWVTINEPGVYVYQGYINGIWPPHKKSPLSAVRVTWNMARAHKRAYRAIHKISPKAQVGIAHNVLTYDAYHHHSFWEIAFQFGLDVSTNHLFYKLTTKNTHDFLGLNYYFNEYISFNGDSRVPSVVDIATTNKAVSDLGWEIFPQGIFDILVDFSDYHKPIYITENGLASTNDDRRCRFLIGYLQEIYHAISAGVDVRGYFHWSLIDNFEWSDGFDPRFGLIEVDYTNLKRIPRPSAFIYKDIIEQNGIPHSLLRFLGHTVEAVDVLKHAKLRGETKLTDLEIDTLIKDQALL